jgi:hypothetical protein
MLLNNNEHPLRSPGQRTSLLSDETLARVCRERRLAKNKLQVPASDVNEITNQNLPCALPTQHNTTEFLLFEE